MKPIQLKCLGPDHRDRERGPLVCQLYRYHIPYSLLAAWVRLDGVYIKSPWIQDGYRESSPAGHALPPFAWLDQNF